MFVRKIYDDGKWWRQLAAECLVESQSWPPWLLHLSDLTSALSNTSDSECYIADKWRGAARHAPTPESTRGAGTRGFKFTEPRSIYWALDWNIGCLTINLNVCNNCDNKFLFVESFSRKFGLNLCNFLILHLTRWEKQYFIYMKLYLLYNCLYVYIQFLFK